MRKILAPFALLTFLFPVLAFALPGVGPRVTLDATVLEVRLTEEQRFDKEGGEFLLRADNGQEIVVVLRENARIITEGRSSRKKAIPSDVRPGMTVRVQGWRVDTSSVTASLVVITNLENNPGLSGNGVLQSVGESSVTILLQSGESRTLTVTNETEVHAEYEMRGTEGLTFAGKSATFTVNPDNPSLLRVLRIGGRPEVKIERPSLRELRVIAPYRRVR